MDFLDPAKKQAHARRLYLGYFLMGVAILLAAVILLVISSGYFWDRKTGQVIQNGLIFTASAPESATITLNGKDNGETDKRLTVPEGQYAIELKRSGYRTWKKTIQLDGGNIERLVYPRLFPEKPSTAVSRKYSAAPILATQSPDRRWVILNQPGKLDVFDVYDTTKPDQEAVTVTLPSGLLTASPAGTVESLKVVEWSTDNRHVLVKHSYGEQFEFLMIDRTSQQDSYSVNKLIGQNPSLVTLHNKKFDKLYIYDVNTKVLQAVDAKTKTVTPLLTGVQAFKPYGDKVMLYTAIDAAQPGKVLLRMLDDEKSYTLRIFETEGDILLEMAQFDGDQYVTAASVKEGRLYIYKNPLDRLKAGNKAALTPFVLVRFANPAKLSFSANTRFIAMQSGTNFAVYDFEENRRYNFGVAGELAADQFATWMDGHRLLINQAGKVQVVEFDGANQQELGTIIPATLPFFDRDYERLFTLSPVVNEQSVNLLRTSLKLKLKP